MNELRQDVARLQSLVGEAFNATGALAALADSGQLNDVKLQRALERTAEQFEHTTLEVRRLCERHSPGAGEYAKKMLLFPLEVSGSVEELGCGWLHITLNTLLPHCRYQTPAWLSDTIRRLLDDYEAGGRTLPTFHRALLVVDEHCGVEGRHIFDQDNKGWKAVSNALKGRVIPDDDQHTLSLALLSTRSECDVCHITLLDLSDAAEFFARRSDGVRWDDFYAGDW